LTVLNVAANIFTIPYFGARGAAWTTVATELLAMGVYGILYLQSVAASARVDAAPAVGV
jgi:hypothetical protein